MIFISQLKAKTNFQVVGITMNCFSPLCKNASRMDQKLRAPVPMTWAFMMREAGFPAVRPIYELNRHGFNRHLRVIYGLTPPR